MCCDIRNAMSGNTQAHLLQEIRQSVEYTLRTST